MIVFVVGMVLFFEVICWVLGLLLMMVVVFFLFYIFVGFYMFDVIVYKGVSLNKVMLYLWFIIEGVFGVVFGVFILFVFLFVFFGVMLEWVGVGVYFIKVVFLMFGYMCGGLVKVVVVVLGFFGLVFGFLIVNVVIMGIFIIFLMKCVGFFGIKVGVVEVVVFING